MALVVELLELLPVGGRSLIVTSSDPRDAVERSEGAAEAPGCTNDEELEAISLA